MSDPLRAQALYRRWRPQTFDEVVGLQDSTLTGLGNDGGTGLTTAEIIAEYPDWVLEHYLQLPADFSPRIAELADKLNGVLAGILSLAAAERVRAFWGFRDEDESQVRRYGG